MCTHQKSFLPDSALKMSYRIGLEEMKRKYLLALSYFLLDLQILEDNKLDVGTALCSLSGEPKLTLEAGERRPLVAANQKLFLDIFPR